jgi:hypothetical protein
VAANGLGPSTTPVGSGAIGGGGGGGVVVVRSRSTAGGYWNLYANGGGTSNKGAKGYTGIDLFVNN